MRIARVLLLLLLAPSVWAQTPHPRIWLDPPTMTRLHALVAANDPTWIALKADADAYVANTVPAYDRSACGANQICYTYEGLGWLLPVEELAIAYQMTGNTAYSNQVKAILNSMAAAGAAPCSVDSGFPSRSAVLALALGYDWIYPTLSTTDKTNYTAELDACWAWVQASGYQWNIAGGADKNGYGNYFGGHLLGYGLGAIAVEGDDSNSASMQSTILNAFNTYVSPAFSSGGFQGGFAVEGYNYGGGHFLRLFQYMRAMTTAGKTDLFNNNISWIKTVAKNFLYERRPDNWAINDEGTWSGSFIRVFYYSPVYDLSGLLSGTTEGGWMAKVYSTFAAPPVRDSIPASLYGANNFELFLYNQGQPPIDYTATQPAFYFSAGDDRSIARTDWTTSAVHTTFHGGSATYADHDSRDAGGIAIQRGADYLLLNAGMWDGVDGAAGSPGSFDQAGWHFNTLFYWDGGTNCLDQSASGGQYAGCQMFWNVANSVKHNESSGWMFQEAPLQNAYLNNHGLETITGYTRSFVNISDVDFVFDRITAPSSSTRKLEWHTPALASAAPPGNATAIAVNGNVASATVANSKIWVKTLLPASPSISSITDLTNWGASTLVGTQRFEVSDPNASSCSTNCAFLTVLAPTASSVTAMPAATLITAPGFDGAIYNDGALPRVALFSVDDSNHSSVTYTASYSAGLTGRHVITDLAPGTYNVTKDGTTIYSGLIVGSDGSLSFTTTGGTTYAITQVGAPPATKSIQPPTGLNGTMR